MAKYSKGAQKSVKSAMKRMEKGTLKSGNSNKKVTNPKQAVAIGLSEAREKGAKVPKKASAKKSTPKKAAAKKVATKKTVKKAAPSKMMKKAAPKKVVSKKTAPKKAAPKKAATKPVSKKQAAPKKASAKPGNGSMKELSEEMVESSRAHAVNLPPVEERSPSLTTSNNEDPIWSNDKKEMIKQTAKRDINHNIHLSGSKSTVKPAGKKPLWRK